MITLSGFNRNNTILQNNYVELIFTPSVDKTVVDNTSIQYEYRIVYYPLYCKEDITEETIDNYLYYDENSPYYSSWYTASAILYNENKTEGSFTIKIAESIKNDSAFYIELRAIDDYSSSIKSNVSKSNIFILLKNTFSTFTIEDLSWSASQPGNIQLKIKMESLGFAEPYNLTNIKDLYSWEYYRKQITNVLINEDKKINYNFYYSVSSENNFDSLEKNIIQSINYDELDWASQSISLLFTPSNISSSKSWFIKIFGQWNSVDNINILYKDFSTTLYKVLSPITATFQIRNKNIKVNFSSIDFSHVGAGNFNRTDRNNCSIALYDTHIESGESEPKNKPDIGFVDDKNTIISKIGIDKDDKDYLSIEIRDKKSGFKIEEDGTLHYKKNDEWKEVGGIPENHKSPFDTYGLGDNEFYGHLKTSDEFNSDLFNPSIAASQSALFSLNKKIEAISAKIQNVWDTIYPIGSIYLSVNSANPSTIFGGEWESWGSGKVPVGVNDSDIDFNIVEKTGGEKEHILSREELPNESVKVQSATPRGASGIGYYTITPKEAYAVEPFFNVNGLSTEPLGSGIAHNNLPPYITCYMWKRIS